MMSEKTRTRFIVIGGYLGAGKTTLTVNLARLLKNKYGKSTAIITNDQGHALVDTEYVQDAGFDVNEIVGGCFCSTFPEFVKNARSIVQIKRPDYIIAEPIGTSTNILSSVIEPLKMQYPEEFEVAPFMVVVDGIRAAGIESTKKLIPAHQVKEAEIVLMSKMDLINKDEEKAAEEEIKKLAPEASIIKYSSKTLKGIDEIAQVIMSSSVSTKNQKGENTVKFSFEKSAMSWYSSINQMKPLDKIDMYDLSMSIMRSIANEYTPDEIAHVKIVIASPSAGVKMSLVCDSVQTDSIHGSRYVSEEAKLIVNARVTSDPDKLGNVIRSAVDSVKNAYPMEIVDSSESCYSPKPETPTFITL